MPVRRSLVIIAAIAALQGAFFTYYLSPDWATIADQEGYRQLGRALSQTGRFTRYPDAPQFVPEVIRTPGYPVFVAAVYSLAGFSQVAVAIAQTLAFAALTTLVFWIARTVAPARVALGAALLTALYPTFAYFAALVMTELWTTVAVTIAAAALVRAHRSGRPGHFAWAGVAFGYAALCRPGFMLLPFAFLGTAPFVFGRAVWPALRYWPHLFIGFLLAVSPWLAFNYAVTGRASLAPAGGVGRGLWEGSWHGRWPGRVQTALTQIAAETHDPAMLQARVTAFAAQTGYDAEVMLTYVRQWKEIRRIWDEPTDPQQRATARMAADEEYRRVALENIRGDLVGYLSRRLTHGAFVLWNADIWLRYSVINATPPLVIRAMWSVQVVLLLFGIAGLVTLWRAAQHRAVWLLGTPLLYVTAVHLPLLTEARQSLPVKPLLLILAAIGIAHISRRLFALEPQVHEREHV
jgi:4-amino-4-deoxy-L-arabinose transferase-like glycosyltransferase